VVISKLEHKSKSKEEKALDKALNGFSVFNLPDSLLLLALVLITSVAFIPCLSSFFVNWDDPTSLLINKDLTVFGQEWSWQSIGHIFMPEDAPNYSPLTITSFALEKYFLAPDPYSSPFVFHLDNLLLHLCGTGCVFFLFRKMNINKAGAFVGALLFGIHPMRVESVAWVTERKDVLYGLFFILSLLSYIEYINTGKSKWYICTLLLSLLAYFSKIQAVFLPLSMVVIDMYFDEKWYAPKMLLLQKLPWWALSVIIGLLNIHYLSLRHDIGNADAFFYYSFIDKLAIGAYSYIVYLVKFIYPYKMSAYYDYPRHLTVQYVCLAILPVLIWGMWRMRKNKAIIFGWLFFTVNVMFMLQVVSAGTSFLADRFTYIAYIGLFFLAAKGYEWGTKNGTKLRTSIYVLIVPYFLLLGIVTYNQCKVWHNTATLWEHNIKTNKNGYYGQIALGSFYLYVTQIKWNDEFAHQDPNVMNKLALSYLDTAISRDSEHRMYDNSTTIPMYLDHALASLLTGRHVGEVTDYTKVLAMDPHNVLALSSRGYAYTLLKKYDLALKDYKQYLKVDSSSSKIYYSCSLCEGLLGMYRAGITDATKSIKLDSTQANSYIIRAKLYRMLHIADSSYADAQTAKRMGANLPPELLP